jgi:glycerate 2-kinase
VLVIAGDHHLTAVRERFLNYERLVSHGRVGLRQDALVIATAALAAVDPVRALRRSVRLAGTTLLATDPATGAAHPFELAGGRVFVIGAGKASAGMATLLDDLLGERIVDGAVAVKRGQAPARQPGHIEIIEAAHPVPDGESLRGGLRLLSIAEQARPDDLLVALVTGGSSSLAVVPAEGITLQDKILTNRLLLASGADIVSINNVRKHISRIKGGLLARAAGCRILNLTVSDVVGDPPDYFTDLTVPDRSTFAMAQEACERFHLWDKLPPSVVERLRRADPSQETAEANEFREDRIVTVVLANAGLMCEAAVRETGRLGYAGTIVSLAVEGDAAQAGRDLAAGLKAASPWTALVESGENTVSFETGPPDEGLGGPSQEGALAAAADLADGPAACILCLDSDGTDGPTDAAGGLVDDLSMRAAAERRVDAPAALAAHASYAALAALDDLVLTGSTGTNVNDLKIALKGPA